MNLGQKIKKARLNLNLSQKELSEKTGISERSLYSYEQLNIMPRSGNLKKIASVLNVSINYLLSDDFSNDNINDPENDDELNKLLNKTSDLFLNDELDDIVKDMFFQSIMEIYLSSKKQENKSVNLRVKRNKKSSVN